MRGIICVAVLVAVIVAVYSGDRGAAYPENRGYPVTLDRARQILSKTDLPSVFDSDELSVEIRANKPAEVSWSVSMGGAELIRYIATLSAAGEGRTRVALELKGAKSGPAGDVEQRFVDEPSARNRYLAVMKEKIASALEGRPVDMTRTYPALDGAGFANLANVRQSMDEAARASEERARARKRGGG
jgi:hypothetical protein